MTLKRAVVVKWLKRKLTWSELRRKWGQAVGTSSTGSSFKEFYCKGEEGNREVAGQAVKSSEHVLRPDYIRAHVYADENDLSKEAEVTRKDR